VRGRRTGARPPHVFVITCHDLGRHLGCYGVATVRSPNLDRLAAAGTRLDYAFAAAPQCSPSRASLATGRYPHANGVMGLTHGGFGWDLHPDERHTAALLAEHGYETHLFGLQHVTQDVDRLGFRHRHAAGSGHGGGTGSTSSRSVAEAVQRFLDAATPGAPLYVEINFFEPHRPYDFGGAEPDTTAGVLVPPYLPDAPEAREELAALQGAIREVDRAVGQVLDALEEAGLAEQAFVLFSADHGLAMPRAKCTLYDPGLGIALLVRWPAGGVQADAAADGLVGNVDALPTILEAAGLPVPERVQGTSFLPLLRGESAAGREAVFAEKTFHSYYDPMRCVRTRRHKYIHNFESAFAVEVPADVQRGALFRADPGRYSADRTAAVELYDLVVDPLERRNLAGRPEVAAVQRDLERRLWAWMEETHDPLLRGPIPSPRFRRELERRGGTASRSR
jgi:N-sulfoglucosamine sulfohydrolase